MSCYLRSGPGTPSPRPKHSNPHIPVAIFSSPRGRGQLPKHGCFRARPAATLSLHRASCSRHHAVATPLELVRGSNRRTAARGRARPRPATPEESRRRVSKVLGRAKKHVEVMPGRGPRANLQGKVGKPADCSPSCLASGAPSAASLPLREERGPLCYRRLAAIPCASLGAEQWGEGGGRNRARSEERPPGGNPRRSDYREATLGGATTGRQRCVGWHGKA
jgi:hypothetical protein